MKTNTKEYDNYLVKSILNSKEVVLFCNYSLRDKSNWLKLEQLLKKNDCSFYRVKNTIFKNKIKNNIFFNLGSLMNGPVLILKLNSVKNFSNIKKTFPSSVLKLSDKLYVFKQFSDLNKLEILFNLSKLNNNFKAMSKKFSLSLVKINK